MVIQKREHCLYKWRGERESERAHRVTEQISQTKCTSAPDSIMVAMTTGPRARQCIYISMSLSSDTSEICQYKTEVYFFGEFRDDSLV